MIKMDTRGQLSAEYILIVGFVIAIVLVVANTIADQTEQNNIATAVRLGAEDATTNYVILTPNQRPIRVTTVNMTSGTNIVITINLTDPNISPAAKKQILNGSYTFLQDNGYTVQNNNLTTLTINTTRHNYLIKVV